MEKFKRDWISIVVVIIAFVIITGTWGLTYMYEQKENNMRLGKRPMIMLNDSLYYSFGEYEFYTDSDKEIDGEVMSTVEGWEIPCENGQSNFGIGYEYRYISDVSIEVHINNKWVVFKHESVVP